MTTYKRTIGGALLQTVVGTTVTNYYLFQDRLGSLVRITSASGAVVNALDFLAFGGQLSRFAHTPSYCLLVQ